MQKKIILLIYFLCLAPQLSFGKSIILDKFTIEEARMNTPAQNRSIIHNTVSSPSLYTAKVFNISAKKYVTKFKDSPVYLVDAIIDEVLYRIKIKELVIYTNTQSEPTNFLYLRIYPNSPMFIMRKDNARFNKVEFPAFITISSYYNNPKINLGPMGLLFGNQNKEIEESLRPLLQSTLEFIVAHEVGHQWWNTVVGSDSINSAWIDESLTNYFALIYFDKIYGRERFEEQKLYNLKLPILLAKFAGVSDKGVNRPSSEFTDTMQYVVVIYSKGAYFYDELSQLLGEDNFLKTARTYYNKYKFSFAPEEGFINVAKKENPKFKSKIDGLYRRWIIEEHMYEDIKGNFIEEVAKMSGVRIPKVVDFDKGLFNSFKDIMSFGSKK